MKLFLKLEPVYIISEHYCITWFLESLCRWWWYHFGAVWYLIIFQESSGSVVECLTRDEGPGVRASPASLRCGPWARHIYPSLVPVQPRKTHPCFTERLLMGRKESNQTNKHMRIPLLIVKILFQSWIVRYLIRVPTRQGYLIFLQGQGKVREFCKMVREIRKSSKVREKSGNFKIMFC